jgi:hypothetical protein
MYGFEMMAPWQLWTLEAVPRLAWRARILDHDGWCQSLNGNLPKYILVGNDEGPAYLKVNRDSAKNMWAYHSVRSRIFVSEWATGAWQ